MWLALWPIVIIAAIYFIVIAFCKLRALSSSSFVHGQTPNTLLILPKVAWQVLRRKQGQLYFSRQEERKEAVGTELDVDHDKYKRIAPSTDEVVTINHYRVKEDIVEKYKQVCGGQDGNRSVPLCFPESLFMTNLLLLVCKPQFKLSPLGLIHIGQTITQHDDLQLLLEEPVSLDTRTQEYRLVPRGVEVDIEMRIIATSGLIIWSGVATLLSRSQVQQSGSAPSTIGQQNTESAWDKEVSFTQVELKAAGNVGVQYARASGDWNPHHLYPWSARLLGYQTPIAHGMWTLSKAMNCIRESEILTAKPSKVEGKFKRPLFLPGTAVLEFYLEKNMVHFRVLDQKTRAPHLIGSLC